MYSPSYFQENDATVIMDFIQQNPFGILCGCDPDNNPVATQIPFLIEKRGDKLLLLGHIQRKTDHYLAFEQNSNALVLFTGAHTYVSASWYTNPQTASTWNYLTVQAKGSLKFLDEKPMLDILKRTTTHFENNPASPALYEKMPADYVQKLAKAIVGFEIEVTTLQNTFKLSQNRDAASYNNIIDKLKQQSSPDAIRIAEEMEKRKK